MLIVLFVSERRRAESLEAAILDKTLDYSSVIWVIECRKGQRKGRAALSDLLLQIGGIVSVMISMPDRSKQVHFGSKLVDKHGTFAKSHTKNRDARIRTAYPADRWRDAMVKSKQS